MSEILPITKFITSQMEAMFPSRRPKSVMPLWIGIPDGVDEDYDEEEDEELDYDWDDDEEEDLYWDDDDEDDYY